VALALRGHRLYISDTGLWARIIGLSFCIRFLLERNLREALLPSDGNFIVFLTRPLSSACLFLFLVMLISAIFSSFKRNVSC
jgi:TctA family transporter